MAKTEDSPAGKKTAKRKASKPRATESAASDAEAPKAAGSAAAGSAAAETGRPVQGRGYEGLARRWRPQTFADLVGQEEVALSLSNSIRDDRIGQGHIMAGPRGVGKTTSARILARALNCESGPTATPCGTCRHCRDIATGNDLDVIEIDAASNTQVEKMRELLERVVLAPFAARRKIYIIDEVHMLSTGSFNALLKTLEEPPRHVVFIFATTELDKIPETVRSRCTIHSFRRMSADDIVRRLEAVAAGEGMEIDPAEAREIFGMIARASEGGMRDALVSLDQVRALTGGKPTAEAVQHLLGLTSGAILADLVGWLADGNAPEILRMVEEMVSRGRNLERFVKGLLAYLHDLMLLQAGGDETLVKSAGEALDRARELAARLPPVTVFNMLNQIFELEARVRTSTQVRFLLEFTLLRMSSVRPVVPIDDLIRRIKALPDEPASGSPPPVRSAQAAPRPAAPAMAFRDSAPDSSPDEIEVAAADEPAEDFTAADFEPEAGDVKPEVPPAAPARDAGGPHPLTGLSRDEIIDYLTPRMPAAQQFLGRYLRQAIGVRADDSRLHVQWSRGERTASGMLLRADNRKALEETLAKICGRPFLIETSFSSEDPESFSGGGRTRQSGGAGAPRPGSAAPATGRHFADSAPGTISPPAGGTLDPDDVESGFAPPPEAAGYEYAAQGYSDYDNSEFSDSDFAPEEPRDPSAPVSFAQAPAPPPAAPDEDAVVRVTAEGARRVMSENQEFARRAKMARDFFNGSFVDSSGRPLAL